MHDTAGRPTVWATVPSRDTDSSQPESTIADGFAVVDDRALADTAHRRLRGLPAGWSTEAVLPDRAYGTVADQRQVIALTGPAQAVTAEAVPVDVMATTALAFAQVAGDPVLYALTKGSEIDQPTPVATSRFSTRPTTRPTPRPTGATSTAVPSKPSGPVKPPTSKPSPKPTTRTTTRTTTPSTKPSGRAG